MTSVKQHVRGVDESHVSTLCIDTEAVRSVRGGQGGEAAGANVAPKYTQDRRCPDRDLSLTGAFAILKWFSSKLLYTEKKGFVCFQSSR